MATRPTAGTGGITVAVTKQWLNDVQEDQGDRRSPMDEYMTALLQETRPPKQFREIREAEGLDAALEWVHEVDKE